MDRTSLFHAIILPPSMFLLCWQMYDLFTKVIDRLKKDKDAEGVRYIEETVDLWTSMMIEEQQHDAWCLDNIHDMQAECEAWLSELASELENQSSGAPAAAIKSESVRATRSAPPPAAPSGSGSKPEAGKPVTMTMKLGMDFKNAGKEGTPERAKFENDLVLDLANASGADPSSFKITKLSPGSVVVETEISKPPGGSGEGADPIAVAKALHKQAEDANSPLRQGKLTRAVEDIAVPEEQLAEHEELAMLRKKLHGTAAELEEARKELDAAKQLQQQATVDHGKKSAADASVREAHELLAAMKKELEDNNKETVLAKKLADQVEKKLSTQLEGATLQVDKLTRENTALQAELAQKATSTSLPTGIQKELQVLQKEKQELETQFRSAREDWASTEKSLRKELAFSEESCEGLRAQI